MLDNITPGFFFVQLIIFVELVMVYMTRLCICLKFSPVSVINCLMCKLLLMQNNLEDLYSLLCFLHVEPWCNWSWYADYSRLYFCF